MTLLAGGGAGAFDADATSADVFQHGMNGIIQAAQVSLHPDLEVPLGKPVTTAADLKQLSDEQLRAKSHETYTLDKQYETQRMKAALAGNMDELNRIIALESMNSQLLILLGEELARRNINVEDCKLQ